MSPQQLKEFEEMKAFIASLKNSTTIPFEVDSAFKARFGDIIGLASSTKGATSENKIVNEGGASTYPVLAPPDGFDVSIASGTVKYYPFYL